MLGSVLVHGLSFVYIFLTISEYLGRTLKVDDICTIMDINSIRKKVQEVNKKCIILLAEKLCLLLRF
jgi:hypothetical protein